MECLTENWFYVGLLSFKSIYVLRMSCVRDIFEIQQKVVEAKLYEGEDPESNDEGNDVILEKNSKDDIKYEETGKSPVGGDTGGG